MIVSNACYFFLFTTMSTATQDATLSKTFCRYNKTESLKPVDLKRFNFLLIGSYSGKDIIKAAQKNFTSHRPLYGVEAFQYVFFFC